MTAFARKISAVLLAMAALIIMGGATVSAATVMTVKVGGGAETSKSSFEQGWNDAVNASGTATSVTVKLNADWTASGTGTSFGSGAGFSNGSIYVPANKNIILDLNGHTVNRAMPQATRYGTVLVNDGVLEIKGNASDPSQRGRITGGKSSTDAGAIINGSGATLTVSAVNITGNSGFYAGGIYNMDGKLLTVRNCGISQNTGRYGGAIFNGRRSDNGFANCVITECILSENTAEITGGAIQNGGGVLNVSYTEISDNSSGMDGAGIYTIDGTADITRSSVYGNTVTGSSGMGGGVMVDGDSSTTARVTMTDCTISDNTARSGAGIYNCALLTLIESTVSDNTAVRNGGGIHSVGKLTIIGGNITGNTSGILGGGVYRGMGDIFIGGDAVIKDNHLSDGVTLTNLYLPDGTTFTVIPDSPLTLGASIGVTTNMTLSSAQTVVITYSNNVDYSGYITSDSEAYEVFYSNVNDVRLRCAEKVMEVILGNSTVPYYKHTTGWKAAVSQSSSDVQVKVRLYKNWDADSETHSMGLGLGSFLNGAIYVSSNKNIVIDLNGKSINRGLTSSGGRVIMNCGRLEITDASSSPGLITGGYSDGYGGGIQNTGTLTLTGVNITANRAQKGGGVSNSATATLTVGAKTKIWGNKNGASETNDNVFLVQGRTISVSSASPLRAGSSIGVTTENLPSSAPIRIVTANDTDYSSYFLDDNRRYAVYYDAADKSVKLGIKKISGRVVSSTSAIAGASQRGKVELIPDGSSTVIYTAVFDGSGSQPYSIYSIQPGKYTLRISKPKHTTREYTVNVGSGNVALNTEIWLCGDINGDGVVNGTDVTQINRYCCGKPSTFGSTGNNLLETYRLRVADVVSSGSGPVNASDSTQMRRLITGKPSVFDSMP